MLSADRRIAPKNGVYPRLLVHDVIAGLHAAFCVDPSKNDGVRVTWVHVGTQTQHTVTFKRFRFIIKPPTTIERSTIADYDPKVGAVVSGARETQNVSNVIFTCWDKSGGNVLNNALSVSAALSSSIHSADPVVFPHEDDQWITARKDQPDIPDSLSKLSVERVIINPAAKQTFFRGTVGKSKDLILLLSVIPV